MLTLGGVALSLAAAWGVAKHQLGKFDPLVIEHAALTARVITLEQARNYGDRDTTRRLETIERQIERMDMKLDKAIELRHEARN